MDVVGEVVLLLQTYVRDITIGNLEVIHHIIQVSHWPSFFQFFFIATCPYTVSSPRHW